MAKIFYGARGSGKTTEMIKLAAETGAYIIVLNKERISLIEARANELDYSINKPITVNEWMNPIRGKPPMSELNENGIIIDDLDEIIKHLFHSNIRGVSCNL